MIDLTQKMTFALMDTEEVRDRWPFSYDETNREFSETPAHGNVQWSDADPGIYLVGYRGDRLLILLPSSEWYAREMTSAELPV